MQRPSDATIARAIFYTDFAAMILWQISLVLAVVNAAYVRAGIYFVLALFFTALTVWQGRRMERAQ